MERLKKRILIIDDEPDIREFISYNLSKKGYEVLTAGNGKTGYEIARDRVPDLIILDILMPVMNGYATCMQLRSNPLFANTRILFLSALSESYAGDLGFKMEADGYISKPIRIDALIRKVEEWVKKSV